MTDQTRLQQYRNIERRHMIRAKDALSRGIGLIARGEHCDTAFVVACIDYLEYIISRFLEQGRASTQPLRQAVPGSEAEDHKLIDDIESTLAKTGTTLGTLIAARNQTLAGSENIELLTNACEHFLGFYNRELSRRKDPAQAIIQKHFSTETYWQQTDDVSAQSIATERKLYQQLFDLAPPGAQPEPD